MYIKGADVPPARGGKFYDGVSESSAVHDGAYSLMVKLFSVAEAIRVRFPLGTQRWLSFSLVGDEGIDQY